MSNKLPVYKTIAITVAANYRNKEEIIMSGASMVYDIETTKLFLRKPLNNFPPCVISLQYFMTVWIANVLLNSTHITQTRRVKYLEFHLDK